VTRIQRPPLPEHALSARYARESAYTDCYSAVIGRPVTHAEFVEAFYTTWLFKLERWILSWSVNKPSTDVQARQIARGEIDFFAAWTLEARAPDQLLMCDFLGATRSWFMVVREGSGTRLYFGSVVTSRSAGYRALLAFHKLYSRALLSATRARLRVPLPG
jgi:hypothetical protein